MPGIDFCQSWGVSKAKQWSGGQLRSPYVDTTKYAEVLNAHADGSRDLRFRRANQINKKLYQNKLALLGTPLYYLIFSFLPQYYSLAFGIFQVLQVILFITSVVMLNSGRHEYWLGLLSLALLLVVVYEPLLSDLRVGNINSFQLFGVAVLIVLAHRFLSGSSNRNVLFPGVTFMCGLVFMTLLKPNLILVTSLLSAHLCAQQGWKVFAKAVIAAAIFGAILLLLPCIYFDSWRVWLDWYNYLSSKMLVYPVSQGNIATVLLVSQALDISVYSATTMLATVLLVLGLGVLLMAAFPGEPGLKALWGPFVRSLRDPYLCAAMGITATLALMPLVWLHYFVISLIPAIWLLTAPHRWSHAWLLGGLSIILTSGLPGLLLIALFGLTALGYSYSIATGWIPLWAGVLATIACKGKAGEN